MYYSKFSQQVNKGQASEQKFKEEIKKLGYKVKNSTKNQNKIEHIDFIISKDGVIETVDVKTKGKMGFTAELVNNLGYEGSLYGSATYIGYVSDKIIYLVNRLKLIKVVEESLVSNEVFNSNEFYTIDKPYYRKYNRKDYNWNDVFVVIPEYDIGILADLKWSI